MRLHRPSVAGPLVAAALLLVGCGDGAASSSVTAAAPPSAPAALPTSPMPSPSPPHTIAPSSGSPEAPGCGPDIIRAIDRTLTRQLAAFNRRDFAAAYALASASFRSGVTLRQFRQVVTSGYPQVLDARSHVIGDCVRPLPFGVVATVTITGADGTVSDIAYRFVRQGIDWRVDGAAPPQIATTA